MNLNTLKTTAFEYINNITINQVICDFFFILSRFIDALLNSCLAFRQTLLGWGESGEEQQNRLRRLCYLTNFSSSTSHFARQPPSPADLADVVRLDKFCVQNGCINDLIFSPLRLVSSLTRLMLINIERSSISLAP